MSTEYDGVVYAICTDNHNLRDYHRSAERLGQTVGVVAGNTAPPAAVGPEVHQAYRPMAPPALRQPQLQHQSNGDGNAGLVAVSSRKNRYPLACRVADLFWNTRLLWMQFYFESTAPHTHPSLGPGFKYT